MLAVAITPAGLMGLVRSFCSINGGPPTKHGGRAPALIVSRPAQRSLHVLIDLPPDRPEIEDYFGRFTLKFAGGSNNDRGGSLNCKLVS